jgi:hypothetical protein
VNFAPPGGNKACGAVYFTAYNDWKQLAAKVVDIFPAYINYFLGKTQAKMWCHPDSLAIIDDIVFIEDDHGNPTGDWTTREDEMGQALLEEDMGIKFDFENFELLDLESDNRVLHIADDASAITFGSALGAEQKRNNNQLDMAVPGASQATIASPQENSLMSGTDVV